MAPVWTKMGGDARAKNPTTHCGPMQYQTNKDLREVKERGDLFLCRGFRGTSRQHIKGTEKRPKRIKEPNPPRLTSRLETRTIHTKHSFFLFENRTPGWARIGGSTEAEPPDLVWPNTKSLENPGKPYLIPLLLGSRRESPTHKKIIFSF